MEYLSFSPHFILLVQNNPTPPLPSLSEFHQLHSTLMHKIIDAYDNLVAALAVRKEVDFIYKMKCILSWLQQKYIVFGITGIYKPLARKWLCTLSSNLFEIIIQWHQLTLVLSLTTLIAIENALCLSPNLYPFSLRSPFFVISLLQKKLELVVSK